MIMAKKNKITENNSPLTKTSHGTMLGEINFPITRPPNERVPIFMNILDTVSNCFGVSLISLLIRGLLGSF